MDQNYFATRAGTTTSTGGGGKGGGSTGWTNPNNILADDAASATWQALVGGDAAYLQVSGFSFPTLPSAAVIDGIAVSITGARNAGYGTISLSLTGAAAKDMGALNQTYGSATDTWGATNITAAQLAALSVTINANDTSGANGNMSAQYLSVTLYWHIAPTAAPTDVPTRVVYKVYSRAKKYLGILPNVQSVLGFSQDINSSGSLIEIKCAKDLRNKVTIDKLQTENDLDITTEDDYPIYTESTELLVTAGSSNDDAMFKNSNIVRAYIYNYWYPNGKLMFTGQINRITFSYGASTDYVNIKVYSLGYDLSNYIARGYPFTYTTDNNQLSSGSSVTLSSSNGDKGAGWNLYGQSFKTGAAVTNLAAFMVRLNGTATVRAVVYDAPNGNTLASVTKSVSTGGAWSDTLFELSSLLAVTPNTTYFIGLWLTDAGNPSILLATSATDVYANGSLYNSNYGGGSGGGNFYATTGDAYFATYSGVPTTTTTYSTQDPVSSTMSKILQDYNNRGGQIKQRNFTAAGYNVTYTFTLATVYDAMKKVIELSPQYYYAYVDLGLSVVDILKMNTAADFKVVKNKDLDRLDISMTIEQVENYLLFSGGAVSGVNLYKEYKNAASATYYGLRTKANADNRVTLAATADAIGNAFIAENSSESHETQIVVSNKYIDITQLVPGKTIGFRNFGNFIDALVLTITRREYTPDSVVLTLGQLPPNLSDDVQSIRRDLLNEQTIANPASPS